MAGGGWRVAGGGLGGDGLVGGGWKFQKAAGCLLIFLLILSSYISRPIWAFVGQYTRYGHFARAVAMHFVQLFVE